MHDKNGNFPTETEVQNENNTNSDRQDIVFNFEESIVSPFNNKKSCDTEALADDIKASSENDRRILKQFEKNEEQNRKFKPKVFWAVCVFIMLQLLVMTVIILIVIIGLVVGDENLLFIHKIDSSVCRELFSFLKYYISATIVELLAMLFFIVKRVFENNVSKMFKANQNRGSKDDDN